tara:strand:- start:259 stop:1935 length:1677 start_codon:yes stop_codon:yes gene_type:complete
MGFFTPFVYRKGFVSGGGGLPPGFDILDDHNAIIWLDSSIDVFNDGSGTPASTGDTAYQWNDQTTYDNHAIQTVAGDRPLYTTGDTCFNGDNVLYFDRGQNDFMSVTNDSSFDSLSALTLFMYFTKNDSQNWSSNDIVTQYSDGPDPTFDGWGIDVQQSFGDSYLRFLYNDPSESFPSGYNELEIRAPKLDNAGPNECELYTFRVGGSGGTEPTLIEAWSGTSFVDSELGNGNGITYTPTSEPLTIGGSAVSTLPSPVSFGKYILYDGALSNSAVTKVQNYIISSFITPGPSSPGTPLMDLDAGYGVYSDSGTTLVESDGFVEFWKDRTTNSNDAEQIDNALKPRFGFNGWNGKPYVHFDNFNGIPPEYTEWMEIANSSGQFDKQEMTMFMVMNSSPDSPNPSTGEILLSNQCGTGGTLSDGWAIQIGSGSDTYEFQMDYGDPFNSKRSVEIPYTSSTRPYGNPQIFAWRFSAGTVGANYIRVNDESEVTTGDTTDFINYGGVDKVLINARYKSNSPCSDPGITFGYHLYRLVVYDGFLDDTTINNFINDLNNFYDIY